MISIIGIFWLTYIISCYRMINNDINNFGRGKLKKIFLNSYINVFINVFIIFPIISPIFIRIGKNNPIKIFPEIFINYFIYEFIYYNIHKNIQNHPIHFKRHNIELASFTCFYASQIDFILLNIFPIYIGLFIINAQYFTYIYFTIMETYISVITNSKVGNRSSFNIYHIVMCNCNFGINLFFDKYIKTYFPY